MKNYCLIVALLLSTPVQAEYLAHTFAGNGDAGNAGDGGVAMEAQLNNPAGVALDAKGQLYIADMNNFRIRKIDDTGVIVSIAGIGEKPDFGGDGNSALLAKLCSPRDITLDNVGNLYFADVCSNRIRKIDTNGIITTVAGNGERGYSGDGGPAITAQLNWPMGVAVDNAGNIYIADTKNQRIRRVDINGLITTIAGDGTLVEVGPVMGGTQVTGTYGGDGGFATDAQLSDPEDVTVDANGNVYIADTQNNRIRRVNTDGIITTIIGDGEPEQLNKPSGIAIDNLSRFYVADTDNHRIIKRDMGGATTIIAGTGARGFSGEGELATTAKFNRPQAIAVNSAGTVYIADTGNHRIRQLDLVVDELPDLGPADIGNSQFLGGISANGGPYQQQAEVSLADTVEVRGQIEVQPAHVGEIVDIFVYAAATFPEVDGLFYYMLGEPLAILAWNQDPDQLVAFISDVILDETQDVLMYSGHFLLPGTLEVYFGYIRADGSVISSTQSIDVVINE